MRRFFKRLRSRLGPALQSDAAFVEAAYLEILGRPADQDGLDHYKRLLRDGLGRTAVLLSLVRSDEFTSRLARKTPALPSLRAVRPERYREAIDRTNGETIAVFDAESAADFDWLEMAILQHAYYEQPGVWNLGVDLDKRVIAEIIASFAPERALELGCAAGAVLECLRDFAVHAEGVEISMTAIERASADVRTRIHHGDLLSLGLPQAYDMVFGLDVFEHLNPNRLDSYIRELTRLAREGAWFFCNVPAFGHDDVFGTVFPLYVDGWAHEAAAGRHFSTIHVDELGYPIHGHLTWAEARWWVERFEAAGLRRAIDVERALHRKYDAYMQKRSPARLAYFVFAKNLSAGPERAVVRRIAAEPSIALSER